MSLPYVGSLNLLLIIGVIAGLVALFAACWLWWRLPKRQVDRFPIDDAKARAEVEDNFRKTISEALLAAAALVGAGLAYLQFTEQQQTSQRQFAAQQEASRAQQEEIPGAIPERERRDVIVGQHRCAQIHVLGAEHRVKGDPQAHHQHKPVHKVAGGTGHKNPKYVIIACVNRV